MSALIEAPFWQRRAWIAQTGKTGIALYAAAIVGFLTNALVARSLGPLNFGDVILAVTVVVSIAALLDFSLEEAVVHHGAKAIAHDEPGAVRALIRTSLRLDLAVGVVVVAMICITAPTIAQVVSHGTLPSVLLVLASLEVLAGTMNGTTGATLMLAGRPDLRAWGLAWTAALRMGAVLIAIHTGGGGAQRVLVGYAIGAGIGAAIQYVVANSMATARWDSAAPGSPPVSVRALVTFGLHSSATTTIIAARAALVTVVLSRQMGSIEVGLLSVALLPVTLADVLTAPVRTTVFAEQAKLAAQGRLGILRRAVRTYTIAAVAVGLAASAVGWFLLPWILSLLYGPSFVAATTAARLLLPAAIATLAVAWAKALPASVGRPQVRTVVSLMELAATGVLVVVFAGRGADGVAAALSLVAGASACLWVFIARRMLANGAPRPILAGLRREEPNP
jgi:O-antigen/teichoic acid export membrane protein